MSSIASHCVNPYIYEEQKGSDANNIQKEEKKEKYLDNY